MSTVPHSPNGADHELGRYSGPERTLQELKALRAEIDHRIGEDAARIEAAARGAPWILSEATIAKLRSLAQADRELARSRA